MFWPDTEKPLTTLKFEFQKKKRYGAYYNWKRRYVKRKFYKKKALIWVYTSFYKVIEPQNSVKTSYYEGLENFRKGFETVIVVNFYCNINKGWYYGLSPRH